MQIVFTLACIGVAVSRVRSEEHLDGLAGNHRVHSTGLELEHATTQAQWPLKNGDEQTIAEILEFVASYGDGEESDVKWTWKDFDQSWTFGLVRLGARGDVETLALHMLHRHGLAPLLASRGQAEFDQHFGSQVATGVERLKVLVKAEEDFEPVQQVYAMLTKLSLSGLRNLHSFDHGATPGFAGGSKDALQAMLSPRCINWLGMQGFTEDKADALKAEFSALMGSMLQGQAMVLYPALLQPQHTAVDLATVGRDKTTDFKWQLRKDCVLTVVLVWEEVRTPSDVSFSLTAPQCEKLKALDETRRGDYAFDLMEDFVHAGVKAHKAQMHENRDILWSNEEAELFVLGKQLSTQQGYPWDASQTSSRLDAVVRSDRPKKNIKTSKPIRNMASNLASALKQMWKKKATK